MASDMYSYLLILGTTVLPLFLAGGGVLPQPGHPEVWLAIAYVVLFPTVLGYLLNIFALRRLRASTTAVYVYIQPLITALAAWWVFAERPGPSMLASAAALFVGITLVSRR